ncbi:hypothetical protein ACQBAU_16190 [Propionibacteriaceae bacterium Y2011]
MSTPTADQVLMGGGGAPAGKIDIGQPIAGRILEVSAPYQERDYDPKNPGSGDLKFFKNGNPILTFFIDLATDQRSPEIEDDDGTRRVYMDGARIKKAVKAAVQAAGANGLTVGSYLAIECTHYDEPNDRRSGKNYQVRYTPGAPPANDVLMGDQQTGEIPAQQAQQAYVRTAAAAAAGAAVRARSAAGAAAVCTAAAAGVPGPPARVCPAHAHTATALSAGPGATTACTGCTGRAHPGADRRRSCGRARPGRRVPRIPGLTWTSPHASGERQTSTTRRATRR